MTPSNSFFVEHFTRAARQAEARGFPALASLRRIESEPVVLPPPATATNVRPDADGKWPLAGLLLIAAEAGGISKAEIVQSSRKPRIVRPAQVYCWLAQRFSKGSSCKQISTLLGGRDHSTVIHGSKRCDQVIIEIGHSPSDDPRSWAKHMLHATWPPMGQKRLLSRHYYPDFTVRDSTTEFARGRTGERIMNIAGECPP